MMISGFTMARNAEKFYYPITESISSVLPIVDEFIVALGKGDSDDHTRELIQSLNSPKIRILDRVWEESSFQDARILREETDFALSNCLGDWCFYLQADEVVHEQDLPAIREACNRYLEEPRVDGFLFRFRHFWGDYDHVLDCHSWYQQDIRIIRNHSGISSFRDAQSFRRGNEKLQVVALPARIFHYGYARPPGLMQGKKKQQDTLHQGRKATEEAYRSKTADFDYGPLGRLPRFRETHPRVMAGMISRFNWKDHLNYGRRLARNRPRVKHEKLKNRILSFVENRILGGHRLWAYCNWKLVDVPPRD
ncbi:MAG TPA: hypothetical protein VMV20_01950 [Chitinophagaceae bacterium]|nr:hypothetical protein [Chitinophagaceae bacterium]